MTVRPTARSVLVRGMLAAAVALLAAAPVAQAGRPAPNPNGPPAELRADLDGRPIKLRDVGAYYCHDFDYPAIHCFKESFDLQEDVADDVQMMALAGTNYAVVYEDVSYAGPYMFVSEDYDVLFWIGWNDRISSFKGKNSGSGRFYTDWYGGGQNYYFCCNWGVPILYSYNDTFSSVYRS